MTPQVAIAAETPQIDTELDSMVAISSSTFMRREKAKYQTRKTTIKACASA